MKDLVPVEVKNVPALFETGGTKALLDSVEKQVRAEIFEVETKPGREHVRSVAANLKRLKVHLDDMGKTYVAELKAKPKMVDAERRSMRDRLDTLAAEIRAPLTALEEAEQARLAKLNERIGDIHNHAHLIEGMSSEEIAKRITQVRAIDPATFEDQSETADSAIAQTLDRLNRAMQNAEELEIYRAKVAKMEAEKLERDKADRERAIREQAIAEARAQAKAEEEARADLARAKAREEMEEALRKEREAMMREREAAAATQARAIEASKPKVVYEPGDPAPIPNDVVFDLGDTPSLPVPEDEIPDFSDEGPDDCRDAAVNDLIELGLEEHVAEDVVRWIMSGRVSHIVADWTDESGYWSE